MTYKNLLLQIKNAAIQTTTTIDGDPIQVENDKVIKMPSGKQLYQVDLNNRIIYGPEVISVQGEHYADTVYFLVDRFYDNMDLAQTNCVIHYVINDQSYIYAVPFCDIRSYDGKIIIPWSISMSATQTSGRIQYFIRFYLIDSDESAEEPQYIYNLNTQSATSRVLTTLSQQDFSEENDTLNLPSYYEELINNFNLMANNATVFWTDV